MEKWKVESKRRNENGGNNYVSDISLKRTPNQFENQLVEESSCLLCKWSVERCQATWPSSNVSFIRWFHEWKIDQRWSSALAAIVAFITVEWQLATHHQVLLLRVWIRHFATSLRDEEWRHMWITCASKCLDAPAVSDSSEIGKLTPPYQSGFL